MVSKKDVVSVTTQLALTLVVPLLIIMIVDGRFNNLEAYIGGKTIGYVQNRGEAIQVYNEIITEISTEYENVEIKQENVEFKKVKDESILLSNKNEIQKGILESITGNVSAYELNIDGKTFGYVNSEEKVNNLLKLVTDKYIEDLDVPKDDVICADVTCEIELKEATIDVASIKTQEEISNEIYKTYIGEDDLLDIDITVKETVEEEIPMETITVDDENLYVGESKEEVGVSGKKLVNREVVYSNGEIDDTTILSEEILQEPQNTVIYRGVKNPYDYGVAFLNRPTRGGFTTSDYGDRWESFHKGMDIAGNIGDDVMVAIDGEVTYSQYNDGGYGNLIMVTHVDNMVTYYAHLDQMYVSVGDKVTKGDVIGVVGNTGFSTGPHLHFELRVDGEPVNPAEYLIG